jgi:ribosomal-protein-alanine N-acetyltransferase
VISASVAHAAALAAIHAAAFPPGEAWSAAAFAELLATPGAYGLIDPAGGIILTRHAADEAEILTLATLPEARRQGIAARLLDAALQQAAARSVVRMFLEVSAGNLAARGLYETAGFVACGRRRRYYPDGSDALVLQRPLSPA